MTGADDDDFPSRTNCWFTSARKLLRQGLVSNSIMMELSSKALMWNFIRHLAEVQQNGDDQGPVVQSIVSLTSSLRVISLTVLADLIHNILIFFAEKM